MDFTPSDNKGTVDVDITKSDVTTEKNYKSTGIGIVDFEQLSLKLAEKIVGEVSTAGFRQDLDSLTSQYLKRFRLLGDKQYRLNSVSILDGNLVLGLSV